MFANISRRGLFVILATATCGISPAKAGITWGKALDFENESSFEFCSRDGQEEHSKPMCGNNHYNFMQSERCENGYRLIRIYFANPSNCCRGSPRDLFGEISSEAKILNAMLNSTKTQKRPPPYVHVSKYSVEDLSRIHSYPL